MAKIETVFAVQAWDPENQDWFTINTRANNETEAVNKARTMQYYAGLGQKFRAAKIFTTTEVLPL